MKDLQDNGRQLFSKHIFEVYVLKVNAKFHIMSQENVCSHGATTRSFAAQNSYTFPKSTSFST